MAIKDSLTKSFHDARLIDPETGYLTEAGQQAEAERIALHESVQGRQRLQRNVDGLGS